MQTRLRSCMGPWQGIIIGFIAIAGGLVLFLGTDISTRTTDRIASLPVLTQVTLADSRPGRAAIVQGRISAATQPRYQDLVAYWREYREVTRDSDGDRRIRWKVDEVVTPPLLIETQGGNAQIEIDSDRSHYDFRGTTKRLQDNEDYRYNGFRANDVVMAVGVVASGSEGMVLDAETVHSGTQQSNVQGQRAFNSVAFWCGVSAMVIGMGMVLIWSIIFFFLPR